MKRLLLFLALYGLGQAASAQGFPTYATQPVSVSQTDDLPSILAREGDWLSIQAAPGALVWNGQTGSGGQNVGGPIIPIGKAMYVTGAIIGASVKSRLQFSSGQYQNFGNPPAVFGQVLIPLGGGTVPLTASGWLKPGSNGGGLNILQVWGKDSLTATQFYTYSLFGTQITADLNFSAKKKMLWIGTSISAGTGPTDTQNMFAFLTRGYLRDSLGYDVRLINLAMSGSTSTQTETYRQRGRYQVGKVDLIFYEHGANDAGQSIPAATTIANLDKMVKEKQRYNPNALFFVLSPSVNGNSTTESNQATLRTALQAYVSGLGDPKVKYIAGTGTAWTAGQSATFTTDGTHPNDGGNRRIYWAIRDYIVNNNLTLP